MLRALKRAGLAGCMLAGLVAGPAQALDPTRIEVITDAAARDTEPIVLTGALLLGWAAPAEVSLKIPTLGGIECLADNASPKCTHSRYEEPEVATGAGLGVGAPIDRLLGYRWDGRQFVQIPFQVDELAVRYLSNNVVGLFGLQRDRRPPDLRVGRGAVPLDGLRARRPVPRRA